MKHGQYWIIKPGQEKNHVHTDYGTKKSTGVNTVPLATIEAPDEFTKTDQRFEAVRYFEAKK